MVMVSLLTKKRVEKGGEYVTSGRGKRNSLVFHNGDGMGKASFLLPLPPGRYLLLFPAVDVCLGHQESTMSR